MAPHVRAALAQASAHGSAQLKPLGNAGIARPVAAHVQAVLGRVAQASLVAPRPASAWFARTVQAAQVEMTTYVRATGKLYVTKDEKSQVLVCEGTSSTGKDQLAVYAVTKGSYLPYRKDLLGYLNYEVLTVRSERIMSIIKVQSHTAGMGTILAYELACRAHNLGVTSMVAGMPAHTEDAEKYYSGLGFDYRAAEEHERKRREDLQKEKGLYKDVDLSKAKIVVMEVYASTADVLQKTLAKLTSFWKAPQPGVEVLVGA